MVILRFTGDITIFPITDMVSMHGPHFILIPIGGIMVITDITLPCAAVRSHTIPATDADREAI